MEVLAGFGAVIAAVFTAILVAGLGVRAVIALIPTEEQRR